MAWLQRLDTATGTLKVVRLKVESEGGIDENRALILQAVLGADRPVLLIGHSKGGLEILDLLVRHPEARGKVSGWAALQSPFFGSPIADLFYEKKLLRIPAGAVLKLLGGGEASIRDLSTPVRKAYYTEHRQQIARVLSSIPHLLVATWVPASLPTGAWRAWRHRAEEKSLLKSESYSLFKITRDYMLRNGAGVHSDGMVPVGSAILPGSRFVGISGPDHGATISETGFSVFNRADRVALMSAVIKMLLEAEKRGKTGQPVRKAR